MSKQRQLQVKLNAGDVIGPGDPPVKKKNLLAATVDVNRIIPNEDIGPDDPKKTPNYTNTKDPNVKIGKHGVIITKQDFEQANSHGYAWKDLEAYADYVGGWAHPSPDIKPVSPYYRSYGGGPNINGGDIAILQARYNDNPQIQQILQRNIAKPGEVPMYGPSDADAIQQLIQNEKNAALATHLK